MLAHADAARAERQAVILRERALAFEARHHGGAEMLGKRLELAPRARPVHAMAGIDHRPLGLGEEARRLLQCRGLGRIARRRDGRVIELSRHFLVPQIVRHFDDRRPAAAVAQMREGAAHDVRHFGRRGQRFRRLGDAAHLARRVVVGADLRDAARIAAGNDQDRDRFAERLGDAAIGVLGAGPALHAEGADLAPLRHARDRVRHVQADALLAHDDRPYVGRRRVLDQVVDRIGAQDLDPFALHDLRDRRTDLHLVSPLIRRAPFHRIRLPAPQLRFLEHRGIDAGARPHALQGERDLLADAAAPHRVEPRPRPTPRAASA